MSRATCTCTRKRTRRTTYSFQVICLRMGTFFSVTVSKSLFVPWRLLILKEVPLLLSLMQSAVLKDVSGVLFQSVEKGCLLIWKWRLQCRERRSRLSVGQAWGYFKNITGLLRETDWRRFPFSVSVLFCFSNFSPYIPICHSFLLLHLLFSFFFFFTSISFSTIR